VNEPLLPDWKPLAGRVTLFYVPGMAASPSTLELYKSVWHSDPDNFQKSDNALAPTVAQGKLSACGINCTVQPGRIDFNITPLEAGKNSAPAIESLSVLNEQLDRIVAAVATLNLANVNRIALFSQMGKTCRSYPEANDALIKIMPAALGTRAGKWEDLIFQINEPYVSPDAGGDRVNLNQNWSARKLQIVTFGMPEIGQPINMASVPKFVEFIVATYSIDINNAVSPVIINGMNLTKLTAQQQTALLRDALKRSRDKFSEIGFAQ